VKARKGLPNCVRAVGWAFFGAIVVMACLGCGGETENISTAQPVTEPAESGQTETLTTGHEGRRRIPRRAAASRLISIGFRRKNRA